MDVKKLYDELDRTKNNKIRKNDKLCITSSTEIQNQNIDVVVFKSPDGTVKQRYYDASNNLVINKEIKNNVNANNK